MNSSILGNNKKVEFDVKDRIFNLDRKVEPESILTTQCISCEKDLAK